MSNLSFRPVIFSLALLLGLSFMTCDFAQAKGEKGEGRPEIQLTAEQKEKAKTIFSQNREATSDTREALKEKKAQLKQLMESNNPDRAQAETLCTEIGVLQGKLLLNRFDLRQQLVKEGLPPQLMDRKDGKGGKGGKGGKDHYKGKREKRD